MARDGDTMNQRKLSLLIGLVVIAGVCALGYARFSHKPPVTGNPTPTNATIAGHTSVPASTNSESRQVLLNRMKTKLRADAKLQTTLTAEYNQGKSMFFKRNYQEAIATETDVIEQDPSFYKAYNLRGIALCFSGHYQSGMQNINKALTLAPTYDYALFNKALALELYAHYNEALKVYHETIPIARPNWKKWSYYGIAAIYGRRGDVKDTVEYLKQAIAMDPVRVKQVARTESDFDNVRSSPSFQALLK